jgi:hypothetical protein
MKRYFITGAVIASAIVVARIIGKFFGIGNGSAASTTTVTGASGS